MIGIAGVAVDVTAMRDLERSLLEVSEAERRRVGSELHDSLGQQLTGVALLARRLERQLSAEEHPSSEASHQVASLIDEAISEVRHLAKGLNPVGLAGNDLGSALRQLAEGAEALLGIPCRIETEGSIPAFRHSDRLQLYRIAQEALTNAARHARATEVVVRLGAANGRLALRVQDDGVGIRTDPEASDGLGLRMMRYRASMIGADLSVGPGPDGGTTIVCELPVR